jgi:hypothetical protein
MEPISWAEWCHVVLSMVTGTDNGVLLHAQRGMELAEEVGSPGTLTTAQWFVGEAHLITNNPQAAIEPLERAAYNIKVKRVARVFSSLIAASLSDAYRLVGEVERARATAQDGVAFTRESGARVYGALSALALVRALVALDPTVHEAEIEETLNQCNEWVSATGARAVIPFITEERGRWATALGHADEGFAKISEAHAQYLEVESIGHAQRLATEFPHLVSHTK